MNPIKSEVLYHSRHNWQFIQREYQPPVSTEVWFVCECGGVKRVETWDVKNETYQLTTSQEGEKK